MSGDRDRLREKILRLQRDSQYARAKTHFYARSDLEEVLTEGAIRQCISSIPSLNKNARDLGRFSFLIKSKNLRTFAILLLDGNENYVLDFLFRREGDSRIPYRQDGLYFLPKLVAHQFLQRQPTFDPVILEKGAIHLDIGEDGILPFLENVKTGKGGFGTIYMVKLYPSCQKLVSAETDMAPFVARKELEDGNEGSNERAVLDLLKELQHPNIVEFLGSYAPYGIRNFLFPFIPLDLKQFLLEPHFSEPDIIYEGIYGLADALKHIHNFNLTDGDISISLIGYHHDLRPANILVKNNTFLIADFGLSKLKPVDEDSKSRLRGGHDDYLGPESFNYEDWTNGQVGRALDIWAFGCILAEIVTVVEGRSIKEFRDARRATYESDNIIKIHYAFHQNGQVSPAVTSWLSGITAESRSPLARCAVDLILGMLNPNQYRRIQIQTVTQSLALLAKEAKFNCISQDFQRLSYDKDHRKSDSAKFIILEQKLFGAWQAAFSRLHREEMLQSINVTLSALSSLHNVLTLHDNSYNKALESISTANTPKYLQRISDAIDSVCRTLPAGSRTRIGDFWSHAVSEIQDIQLLEVVYSAPKPARYRLVGIKAAMTYMSRIISDSIRSGGRNPSSALLTKDESRTMGFYHLETGRRRAMIEWKEYDHRWQCEPAKEILKTMDALANLLDPNETPRQGMAKDRVLDCVGYFHQQGDQRFGFVYVLPLPELGLDSNSLNLFSLNNVIRIKDPEIDNKVRLPDFGEVFLLVKALASCLLAFHEVGWLHKNFSSHHILVFSPSAEVVHQYVGSAVLAGFNDSRPEASVITFGPRQEFPHYQHPLYQQGVNFRRSFDYFGLGIVLLELGLWQPIFVLRSDHGDDVKSPEEFRRILINDYVPVLGEKMGTRYRNAVYFCLDAEAQLQTDGESAEAHWGVHETFWAKVVEPLSHCCV